MSSIPPTPPPGSGAPPPNPPYDPKTQWRVYRAQQRAAWKAQRDAWKAQQHAWKANYVAAYGPRVPSVVGPIILIVLAFVGFGAAGWNNFWGPFHNHWGNQGDDFFNIFGLPEHDSDKRVLTSQIPANAAIEIQNPRGDVSIAAGDGSIVEVQAHEMAYANSDAEAKKIFDSEAAHVTVNGSAVLVKSESNSSGRINLTVTVPKTAKVTVSSGKGDVMAAGLGAGIGVTAAQGDVHLSDINGSIQAHLSNGKHDFSAHQVNGDQIGRAHV